MKDVSKYEPCNNESDTGRSHLRELCWAGPGRRETIAEQEYKTHCQCQAQLIWCYFEKWCWLARHIAHDDAGRYYNADIFKAQAILDNMHFTLMSWHCHFIAFWANACMEAFCISEILVSPGPVDGRPRQNVEYRQFYSIRRCYPMAADKYHL